MNIPTDLFIDGQYRKATTGRGTLTRESRDRRNIRRGRGGGHQRYSMPLLNQRKPCGKNEWRDLAPGKRAEILFNVARVLREHVEEIAQLETLHVGKPISDARDEATLGARVFEYYAGAIGKFCGQTIPVARGGFDFTLRQPMGVVACIVPWNFPFPIACWKVAPALAAGNCVLLKPATISPLTALKLGELAHAAGLPAGVLQVLPGLRLSPG